MALGQDTFTVFDEFFHSGIQESVAQNLDAFNAASNGAITLTDVFHRGQFKHESFFKLPAGTSRRDPTTPAGTATAVDLTQDEEIGVKIASRFGPFDKTRDAWAQMGSGIEEMAFRLGVVFAEARQEDMLNTSLLATVAAIGQTAGVNLDTSGETITTLTHGALNRARALWGDRSGKVAAYVAHGKPAHDLVGQAITDQITNVADVAVVTGNTATLGKPMIMTDAAGLVDTVPVPDDFFTLGIQAGGIRVEASEPIETIFTAIVGATATDNLKWRFQAEYTFTLFIAGHKWDIAAGGAYPDDTALALATNWDVVATSIKDLAAVMLTTK